MSSEACCKRAPVKANYTPTGSNKEIDGLQTYVTGPSDAKRGVVLIYDIFGIANQTLQGADLLSESLDAVVLVPDFFKGDTLDPSLLPADTEEKKQKFGAFMTTQADIATNVKVLKQFRSALDAEFPSAKGHWGVFGLCWGGKVGMTVCGKDNDAETGFRVSGQAHGARLDVGDAESTAMPHINLASKDEPADVVAAMKKILETTEKKGVVETYSTMFHGWMGARANLENEDNYKEYSRGYGQIAGFFNKHL